MAYQKELEYLSSLKTNEFLQPKEAVAEKIRQTLRVLYKQAKDASRSHINSMPELLIEGYDGEQIWEQLALHDAPLLRAMERLFERFQKNVPRFEAAAQAKATGKRKRNAASDDEDADFGRPLPEIRNDESDEEAGEGEDDLMGDAEGEEDEAEDMEEEAPAKPASRPKLNAAQPAPQAKRGKDAKDGKKRKELFSMSDMHAFLREQDEAAEREEEEDEEDGGGAAEGEEDDEDDDDIDFFADPDNMAAVDKHGQPRVSGKGAGKEAMFDSFFDDPDAPAHDGSDDEMDAAEAAGMELDEAGDEGMEGEAEGEEDDAGSDDLAMEGGALGKLTPHQRRTLKLQKNIQQLEHENMKDKTWTLRGEINSKSRPTESLLEEAVEFEHATRPAPVITEETTTSIEDLIKRRIAEGSFDDVVRKRAVVPKAFKPRAELDQEKSKVGLGEIYEQDYMAKAAAANPTDKEEGPTKEQKAILELYKDLCHRLDALSNFHFTPKPPSEQLEVISNVAAIGLEEALPTAVSTATLLTPEEVFLPKKHQALDSSATHDDRRKERQQKKRRREKERKQRAADEKLVEKSRVGLGNKYVKEKTLDELRSGSTKGVTVAREGGTRTDFTKSSQFFAGLGSGKVATKHVPVTGQKGSTLKL